MSTKGAARGVRRTCLSCDNDAGIMAARRCPALPRSAPARPGPGISETHELTSRPLPCMGKDVGEKGRKRAGRKGDAAAEGEREAGSGRETAKERIVNENRGGKEEAGRLGWREGAEERLVEEAEGKHSSRQGRREERRRVSEGKQK